jgi:hypothetical protein
LHFSASFAQGPKRMPAITALTNSALISRSGQTFAEINPMRFAPSRGLR